MSDAATASPTAAPTNGSGSNATQTSSNVHPTADTATGPQTPAGKVRGPDGKFASPGPEAPKPPPAKLRIKDLEMEEEAAHAEIMRGRASGRVLTEAQKRLQRAEALETGHSKRLDSYKADLSSLFRDANLSPEDAKRVASEYLYKNHIEPGTLTPEQTEARALKAELDGYKAKELEAKDTAAKSEQEKMDTEQAKEVEGVILKALEAGGVPSSRFAVARMASKMEAYERRGVNLDPGQVAELVRQDYGQEFGQLFGKSDVEDIRALVGDEAFRPFVRKVLEWGLAQGPRDPTKPAAPRRATTSQPSANRKHITPQEFLERMKGK